MIRLERRKNEGCRDDPWSHALGDGLDSLNLRVPCITDLTKLVNLGPVAGYVTLSRH